MTLPRPPVIDARRSADFESELMARARTWIPLWGPEEGEPDFGQALLQIAARLSSEVAERLDRVGDKAARGFLDWLAIRGDAARPARMPVAFKLAETAHEPVLAPHPVKMQVDVADATVTFESETDINIVPGRLDLIVGVDPATDAVYLPPPGLSSLDPLEPAPTQWQLKDFAAPGSSRLQFDPGAGLVESMLVEIAGAQYTIHDPKADLATIDPAVPAGEGFAGGTLVKKIDTFHPFDGARNQQNHILYLGDTNLLNVEAEATIDVIGAQSLGAVASWEYWGKIAANPLPGDDQPQWRALMLDPADPKKPGVLVLSKPKGSIEPVKVGETESRWIRARVANLAGDVPLLTGDGIMLRINAPAPGVAPAMADIDPTTHPPAEAIVNTTPAPTSRFYLLGREPRLFDTLYIGCAEAFSKPGAKAWVQFNLAASVFSSLSGLNAGPIGFVLSGIDTSGALQLFRINADGTLVRLSGREPMTPGQDVTLNPDIAPVMWLDGGATLNIASVGKDNKVYVWQEVWPFAFFSGWHDLGSPPKHTAADSPVLGLVLTHDTVANSRALVGLRDKRLSKRPANTAAVTWVDVAVNKAANTTLDIDGIAQIRHENPFLDADRLLAVAGSPAQTLYSVNVNVLLADELLSDIAPDVHPFAIQRNAGTIEAVAIKSAHDALLAAQGTALNAQVALDPDLTITKATLGARVEGGQFAAYAVAGAAAGAQALVAWLPFAAGISDAVFRDPPDAAVGALGGGLTIVDPPGSASLAVLPGNNKGEIFAAELGGSRTSRNALQSNFLSALAVSQPFPALAAGDTVAPDVTGHPEPAVVAANPADGKAEYANRRFFLLKAWLDRNTDTISMPVFQTSAAATGQVTVVTPVAPFKLKFPATVASLPTWILVDDGTGTRNTVEVISYDVPTHTAVVDILATALATPVDFWTPSSTIQGGIFPALELDSTNNDWTVDALDRGAVYFSMVTPARQRAIVVSADALKHPRWIGFESPWINPPAGVTTFIVDGQITKWAALFGDSTANPALTWEYWNGSGWRWLNVDDQTSNFRNSGLVIFTVPPDLTPVDWAGKTNHWIRARLVGGDYGREKVVVKTKTNTDGSTEQTIDRTTEGIQPPFAIDFQVSYSIDKAMAPSFLLTQDSLTLRDQSDANRTPGAQIDVFTPLIYTLTHFETNTAKTGTAGTCTPECDCPSGNASTSPTNKPVTPPKPPPRAGADDCDCTSGDTASVSDARAGRRALYLGFTSKLIGEPINVLLAAQEQNFDVLAPLTVEALVSDQFVPIVAQDGTRALGESGIVSMSFAVEPVPTEMFGQTLSWLRLTPASGGADWNPALLGAYLNAVWARSAETMTRELVGSSEGAPNLVLQLARPPLLHDSLELRVREPLGIEERQKLLLEGADKVLSDVQDLPGDWVLWTKVVDPHDYQATDRVYSLDEDTGIIQFGDGLHGAIPPIGVDAIVAFQYQRTDPSIGDDVPANNVPPRTALNLVTPIESVETAVAAGQSAGGLAPESADRVVKFGATKLRHRGRAVTARDFEDIALEEFAGVVQARCFVRAGKIQLVVVMRGADPVPSRAQRRELRAVLLASSSAAVGAPGVLTINGPVVRLLRIDLTLRVSTLDVAGAVASKVKSELKSFFDAETGGESREGWPLGASPGEDDVAGALLDTPDLEGIADIALFEIGTDGTAQPWPASIKSNEQAMLADDGIRIDFEIVEAVE